MVRETVTSGKVGWRQQASDAAGMRHSRIEQVATEIGEVLRYIKSCAGRAEEGGGRRFR